MKIEAINDNCFYVLLTNEDMQHLGISFEELDYSDIETKRVIWTLLEEARLTLGRDIDPRERMLIEVSKVKNGCRIEFTLGSSAGTGRLKIKKESPFLTAVFGDFSALCSFFENNAQKETDILTELYTYNDCFAAVLSPEPAQKKKIRLLLGEFTVFLTDDAVITSAVREHGRLIFQGSSRKLCF